MLGVSASASSDIHGVVGALYDLGHMDATRPDGPGWLAIGLLGPRALDFGPSSQWMPAALCRVDGIWQILVRRVVDPASMNLYIGACIGGWAFRERVIETDVGAFEVAPWLVLPRPALEIALAEGLTAGEIARRHVTLEGVVAEQIASLRRARPGSGVYRALA